MLEDIEVGTVGRSTAGGHCHSSQLGLRIRRDGVVSRNLPGVDYLDVAERDRAVGPEGEGRGRAIRIQ